MIQRRFRRRTVFISSSSSSSPLLLLLLLLLVVLFRFLFRDVAHCRWHLNMLDFFFNMIFLDRDSNHLCHAVADIRQFCKDFS